MDGVPLGFRERLRADLNSNRHNTLGHIRRMIIAANHNAFFGCSPDDYP